MSDANDATLVLFGRAPTSPKCKTRLARGLNDRTLASRAYDAMVRCILWQTGNINATATTFYCASEDDRVACAALLRTDAAWGIAARREIPCETQIQSSDVGTRVADAFERASRKRAESSAVDPESVVVCVAGTDVPMFSARHFERARDLAMVEDGAVAFGPCGDGGFYCVAVRATKSNIDTLRAAFEDVPWSTSRTLESCVEACRARGLRPTTDMETLADVDEASDLARVARESLETPNLDDYSRECFDIMRACVKYSKPSDS